MPYRDLEQRRRTKAESARRRRARLRDLATSASRRVDPTNTMDPAARGPMAVVESLAMHGAIQGVDHGAVSLFQLYGAKPDSITRLGDWLVIREDGVPRLVKRFTKAMGGEAEALAALDGLVKADGCMCCRSIA